MSRRPKNPQAAAKRFSWFWLVPVVGVGALLGVVIAVGYKPGDPSDRIALDLADDTPGEMVLIPGGTFVMGRDDGPEDEKPAHEVTLAPFYIDKTEVTNAQFAAFVKATNYVTVAERKPSIEKYPGADPSKLVPGSAVFYEADATLDPKTWGTPYPPWWRYVPGACWRRPAGTGTDLTDKGNYPVVQIAWDDAVAYASWAKKRLPTEAEWEYAARGGLARKEYCWGEAHQGQGGKWYANAHQGSFPKTDTGADGFAGASPVGSFPPNGYGLYDMSGNVWEWCQDWYDPRYYAASPRSNPPGPEGGEVGPDGVAERVRRGGSFLCDDTYCRRYLPSARDHNPTDSSANHTGFRCAKDAK
jgi:sulfatase modifying factor 1